MWTAAICAAQSQGLAASTEGCHATFGIPEWTVSSYTDVRTSPEDTSLDTDAMKIDATTGVMVSHFTSSVHLERE